MLPVTCLAIVARGHTVMSPEQESEVSGGRGQVRYEILYSRM